jgi:hypothetical protein
MRLKGLSSPCVVAFVSGLVALGPSLHAQTAIQLFTPVDTAVSFSTTTASSPYSFNVANLSLTCNASPIVATLSGPLMNPAGTAPALTSSGASQPGGNLLVDNNIIVTVTPPSGIPQAPVNVCTGGLVVSDQGLYNNSCFIYPTYGANAVAGALTEQNPDTFTLPGSSQTVDAAGGVAPIDISSTLAAIRAASPDRHRSQATRSAPTPRPTS